VGRDSKVEMRPFALPPDRMCLIYTTRLLCYACIPEKVHVLKICMLKIIRTIGKTGLGQTFKGMQLFFGGTGV
jgi:hypothetical protein